MAWTSAETADREFEELLLANMNSLYNLGLRLTGNREEAADLVQETSLKAFRFFYKYEEGTNFKAWVLTILRNSFINKYRKKKREPFTVNFEDYEVSDYFATVPESRGFEDEIFSEHVQDAINTLPEELKTVVTLFYVEGLAYKEIAGVMDCPIGTVMSRLYTARQMLKKQLKECLGKEDISRG